MENEFTVRGGVRIVIESEGLLANTARLTACRAGDRDAASEAFEGAVALQKCTRLRRIHVVLGYGMFDRREAPQYYPEAGSSRTGRA